MSGGNSERKKLVEKIIKKLLAIIVVLIISYFGGSIVYEGDFFPQEGETTLTNGELQLTMIDVGQADSFLLVQGNETALIDCGTRGSGDDVVKYLKEQGIEKIDYLFGTHPHDDHMGGMYDVITNVEVGKIIIPKVKAGQVTSAWYIKLMDELKNGGKDKTNPNYGGYDVEYVTLGTEYELGDATIKVIGPIDEYYGNVNNYSTVLKVTFGQMDVIMTGDSEIQVEEQILESRENIDAEILKVGHHGSDTSTSEEFLDAISPQYALISTEVGNKFNHPIKTTMDKLESRQIEVYRTDENGTVVVTITATDATFSTEPGDYLSGEEVKERYGDD